MARKPKDVKSQPTNRSSDSADRTVLARVQELTWAMLDEQITDDEFRLLENLLLSDDEARNTYVNCVQLHVELLAHYSKPVPQSASTGANKTPVLGFLQGGTPLGMQSSPDDVTS